MSESDEPNLFLRKQDDSDDYDEKWDDSEIIEAYDKAVLAVKRKLTKKIQRELGLKDEDVEEFLSGPESPGSKPNKNGKKKDENKKKTKKLKWKVGSSCRAVFSEDGEEYEAVVVKVLDSNWCIVRYVGYENEEEVLLEDLAPSLGKIVIQSQIEAANSLNDVKKSHEFKYEDKLPEPECRNESFSEEMPRFVKRPGKSFGPSIRRLPMSFPVPPPPPTPPGMMISDLLKPEDDFHSLLMSWYMCGYYTGLYERGQQLWKN